MAVTLSAFFQILLVVFLGEIVSGGSHDFSGYRFVEPSTFFLLCF
jgi:hypothetical protein